MTKLMHALEKIHEEIKEQENTLARLRKERDAMLKVQRGILKLKREAHAMLQVLDSVYGQ